MTKMRDLLAKFPIVYFEDEDVPRRLIGVAHPCSREGWHDMEECGIPCTNVWIQIDPESLSDMPGTLRSKETGLYEIEVCSPFDWNDEAAMASLLVAGDYDTTLDFLRWLGIEVA